MAGPAGLQNTSLYFALRAVLRTFKIVLSLGPPGLTKNPGFAVLANPFSGKMCHWHIFFIRFTLAILSNHLVRLQPWEPANF
jgi:hypothetical protein